MEDLNTLVSSSLEKYYTTLELTGYSNSSNRLLVLIGILEMISAFSEYITDADMRKLTNILYCIGGDCIIDYPKNTIQSLISVAIKSPCNI